MIDDEKSVAAKVADGYWDMRTDDKMERDEKLEITADDYRRWAVDAIAESAAEKAEA